MIRFTLRIPNIVNYQLEKMAKAQGRSKADLIKAACWELVEQYKQKEVIKDGRRKKDCTGQFRQETNNAPTAGRTT